MKTKPFTFIYSVSEISISNPNKQFHHGNLTISGHYYEEDRAIEIDMIDSIMDEGKERLHHYKDACGGEVPERFITAAMIHCEKQHGIDRFEQSSLLQTFSIFNPNRKLSA